MQKLNLTSFGQRVKLSHYSQLKIKVNTLDLLCTKEFIVVETIT